MRKYLGQMASEVIFLNIRIKKIINYTFSQMVGEINNWIDNNDSQKELCKILDGTGYFQQKKSNYLIWAYDGYVFKLSGDISKNEMIQLANSLTLVNEGDLY